MALIKCPNCEKEISDISTTCIHCGYTLAENAPLLCSECGMELAPDATVCQNCGCPVEHTDTEDNAIQKVELTGVKVAKNTRKKIIIGVVLLLIIALGVTGIFAVQRNDYQEQFNTIVNDISKEAVKAEAAASKIQLVWHDCIYTEYNLDSFMYIVDSGGDFNVALNSLFADETFSNDIKHIQSRQESINLSMKDLTNPPKSFEEAYDALQDYYKAYTELANMATSPSGSLQTYTDNYNRIDSELLSYYNKVKMYVKEESVD